MEKDTFLINMITNIIETKRIKEEDNVNNVIVKELNVNYNISSLNENDSQQSALDIKWNVHCINLDESLCNYHLLYAKSESRKKAIPNATITEFGSDKYEATLTDLSNGLYNHFYATFNSGKLSPNAEFMIEINLTNYYRFVWSDCEVLLINTGIFGNYVENLNVMLTFNDSKIANINISVYKVDKRNFCRKLIQESPCQKNENGSYEYRFRYDKKVSNEFFFIKIPKST